MPFGCWWFLNNPSIVEEITRERIEMLGASFIPQHSDARVLEQVIYKWRNTRAILTKVLTDTYRLLMRDGRAVRRQDIQRDVNRMFRTNFEQWTGTK
jgi:alpha-galactosidase/6-phospho-beta-glucosidase family protein